VVGGGFIGLEMVENLVHRGIKTTLVEMLPQVCTSCVCCSLRCFHVVCTSVFGGCDLLRGRNYHQTVCDIQSTLRYASAAGAVVWKLRVQLRHTLSGNCVVFWIWCTAASKPPWWRCCPGRVQSTGIEGCGEMPCAVGLHWAGEPGAPRHQNNPSGDAAPGKHMCYGDTSTVTLFVDNEGSYTTCV
jgi:hypothetical protein